MDPVKLPPADPKKKLPPPPGSQPPRSNVAQFLLWNIPVLLILLWFWQSLYSKMRVETIPYSQFKAYVAAGEVTQCTIDQDDIEGEIVPHSPSPQAKGEAAKPTEARPAQPAAAKKSAPKANETPAEKKVLTVPRPEGPTPPETPPHEPGKPFKFRTVRVEDPQLVEQLEAAQVKFAGERPSVLSTLLWTWILPLAFFGVIWYFLSRRIAVAGQTVMNIGKSKAQIVADTDTTVRFDDVAGCDEAKYELEEVVEFLKNPGRYQALGAKIPKGILLVGPPGTGKTLLARAVAGEAHVPFFSISGSDFVEMFVGVGASRVRDLFGQARAQAPAIVFIDEIDALGSRRSVHFGAMNDEREQHLNQFLAEMDGFAAHVRVTILAATNRPEVLDRALLRPGRFDRQVVVDAPDVDGREAILKVHARDKRLGPDVNLRKIAQATAGFSGADLANALNEAALLTARRGAGQITQHDIEEAVEKVVGGPERRSRRLDPEQKRRVAYHEVGHALVAAYSRHADPVHKISVIPRGRAALGYTLQIPTEDQFLMTRSELVDRIKGMLG